MKRLSVQGKTITDSVRQGGREVLGEGQQQGLLTLGQPLEQPVPAILLASRNNDNIERARAHNKAIKNEPGKCR